MYNFFSARILKSNNGSVVLLYKDYTYSVTSRCKDPNSLWWKCSRKYSMKCDVIVKTVNGIVVKVTKKHNHESDEYVIHDETFAKL